MDFFYEKRHITKAETTQYFILRRLKNVVKTVTRILFLTKSVRAMKYGTQVDFIDPEAAEMLNFLVFILQQSGKRFDLSYFSCNL